MGIHCCRCKGQWCLAVLCLWCFVASSLDSNAYDSGYFREASDEVIDALIPKSVRFKSVADVEKSCRELKLWLAPEGTNAATQGMTLEEFRKFAHEFYASGYVQQGETGRDAILNQKQMICEYCPQAVLQALVLKIEELFISVHDGSLRNKDEQHQVLRQAEDLQFHFGIIRQWVDSLFLDFAQAASEGSVVSGSNLDWPIEFGLNRAVKFYDMLWDDVRESQEAWLEMENAPQISDEQYSSAMADVADVLDSLQVDWWPCRGTLIALLRHGQRTGKLTRGLLDVVEQDVDVMIGINDEASWKDIAKTIESHLLSLGWLRCWSKSSVQEETPMFDMARYDILYCVRTTPFYILLDASSYIIPDSGPDVYVHRICTGEGKDGEHCEVLSDVGPLRYNGGVMRKDAILPLARCRAGSRDVPCPARPLDTIQAMAHGTLSAACIALPTVVGRDMEQPYNLRLEAEGLVAGDVRVLRRRAGRLDAMGYQSMLPYFDDACDGADLRDAPGP